MQVNSMQKINWSEFESVPHGESIYISIRRNAIFPNSEKKRNIQQSYTINHEIAQWYIRQLLESASFFTGGSVMRNGLLDSSLKKNNIGRNWEHRVKWPSTFSEYRVVRYVELRTYAPLLLFS